MNKILMFLIFVIVLSSSAFAQDLTDSDCGILLTESSVLTEDMTCSGTGIFITDNNTILDCNGFSITYAQDGMGIGVNVTEVEEIFIKNCEIIESAGDDNYGIYIKYSAIFCPLGTCGEPPGGIPLDISTVRVENNIIETTGEHSYDLGLFNADLVKLYNQNIGKYNILNSRIRISDGIPGPWFDGKGLISFDQDVTETGINLSSDILIEENFLKINSAKTGFNKTTRVKFYGVPICGGCEMVYRDNSVCSGALCNDLTVEGSGTGMYQKNYTFNVSSLIGGNAFTNYTIGSTCNIFNGSCNPGPGLVELFCEGTMDDSLVPDASGRLNVTNSLNCNNSVTEIKGLKDVRVSFEGHTFEFGNIGASGDYGFEIIGLSEDSNLELENFNINHESSGSVQKALSFKKDSGRPKDLNIYNFTINTNTAHGLVIEPGENIQLSDGMINVTNGTAIEIKEDSLLLSINITLKNLTIVPSKVDLNVSNSQVNLIDQSILNYSFTDANITVINDDGQIKFNELITETGTSLNSDIIISNNFVSVDSGNSNGLNVSAEVTLYDVRVGRGEARILKDGEVCTDCGSLIQSGKNEYTFTVTGFSNYTIDASMCGWYVNESSVLNESLNCSGTGLFINESNIVLDCDGFNITYGNSGENDKYGVYNNGFDNVTIQNCGIIEGSSSGINKHGIYIDGDFNNVGTQYGLIENNDIITLSNRSAPFKFYCINLSVIRNNSLIAKGEFLSGILIGASHYTNITHNTINVSKFNGTAINLTSINNYQNEFKENIITQARRGIYIGYSGAVPPGGIIIENTILENNTLSNIVEYELWGGGVNLTLINQRIEAYNVGVDILKNSFGKIIFGSGGIYGTGSKLMVGPKQGDIRINHNEIYVNSSQSGFNKSAVLTFYNANLTGNMRATRNNVLCGAYCGNMTQEGDNYTYNVTSFTRYGLTSDGFCDDVISWNLNQTSNLECSGTAWHIGADNITIDCQGHNITYGNGGFGHGINNTGYNNVTIKNCNFIEGSGSGNDKHAMFYFNTNDSVILNNTITTTNTGYGLYINYGLNNQIDNNTIIAEGDYCYGIKIDNNEEVNIKGNTISTEGYGFESSAIKIGNSGQESTIHILNNILNTDGQNAYGIHAYLSENILIETNDIETSNLDAINIYLEHSENNQLINNSVKVNNGAAAIYIYGYSDNNLLENNTIERARYGIHLKGGAGDYPNNNTLINNEFQIITQRDIFVEPLITNLWLEDQSIERYYIESSDINFRNEYGIIDFTEQVSGTGENLDEDLFIEFNNLVAHPSCFDVNANLTIYNITTLSRVEAKKDGSKCGDCGNVLTSNYSDTTKTYEFSIVGFSNYSVGEWSVGCDDLIDANLNYTTDLICDDTAWHIGADDIVIDCQGHNITYGNGGFGHGINNTGYNNVTIKNCNFIEGVGSGNYKHAINIENSGDNKIFNNTITTTNTGYGLYMNYGRSNKIENNTITTINNDCYGIFGEQVPNLILKRNEIDTLGEGYESTAIKIEESTGVLIEKNVLTTVGNNAYGLRIYDIGDSELLDNSITTTGTGSITLYIDSSDNNLILNNTLEVSNGVSAIYAYGHADNNLLENNTVTQAVRGIHFFGEYGSYPDNNTLVNNDLQTIAQRDLVVEEDVTNLWLEDQSIERYYIESSDINFRNEYGIIDFTEQVSGTGENLDEDLFIEFNNLGNSINGFDKKADLTIYNITILGTAEAKKDGSKCENDCGGLTNNSRTYYFNVTGFSNYSVGEMGVECGDTINDSLFMIYNLDGCSNTGIYIGADNVIIDCNGFNITYGDGQGINNTNHNNILIKNCNIIGSGSGTDNDAIYYQNSNEGIIENNSLTTINNASNGIYLKNTLDMYVEENYINSSGEAFYLEDTTSTTFAGNTIIQNETINLGQVNGAWFIDQEILGYQVENAIINFEETDIGAIEFLEGISGSGNNLSEDIIIEENYIYVNSVGINGSSGLNKSAKLTFYNLTFNGTVEILKDGETCDGGCSELFVNESNSYWFNVTGFSNYTLTSSPVVCGQTIYNTLYLNESLICNETAINLGADNVIIDCQNYNVTYGNNSFGYGVNVNGYNNFIIKNCNFFESYNGSHAIYMDGNNGEIYNNIINVINKNSSTIYLNDSEGNNIWNNTLNSTDTDTYIILLFNSSLNNFENNSIIESGKGIFVRNSNSNIFMNNTFSNIKGVELNVSDSDFNILYSQEINNYDLKGIVYFENNYGKLEYNENLNQIGDNLSLDINITQNSIEVNGNKEGLNKSARLIFYNINLIDDESPVPYKNGVWCPGDICSDFSNSGDDYTFNVTGFSNYGIGSIDLGNNFNLDGSIILYGDLDSGYGGNVIADNVVLDCNGYEIRYGEDSVGINNSGYDNFVIKDCIFRYVNPSSNFQTAVYLNNAENSLLQDNIFLNHSDNQYNIYINSSNGTTIKGDVSNYQINDSLLNLYNAYGRIEYDDIITQNGTNLSEDYQIADNSIYVNEYRTGLDTNADLIFYDLAIPGTAYAKKDGQSCPSSVCGDITSSGNDYFFSVTGFSTYSVGSNINTSGDDPDDPEDPDGSSRGFNFGSDIDDPEIGSPFPQGIIYETMPTISVVTDEVATCRWDFKDREYGRMDNKFQALGMIHTWSAVEQWELGQYRVYVRCRDAVGNTNPRSYSWTFEIAERTSECGNDICEYGEDEDNCPEDCKVILNEISGENLENEGENLAGQAYSILELIQNTELGSWLVYFLILLVFVGGYFISQHTTSAIFGTKKKKVDHLDELKPEILLSAKKIKYQLLNNDSYNASLEYLNLKRLYLKIPDKYKEEKKFMYNYILKVYEMIEEATEKKL